MYSFRAKKVMQPGDVPHRIALTDAGIRVMHAADGHEDSDVPVDVVTTRSQAALKMLASVELCPRTHEAAFDLFEP
jgi:hypothetical protein